MTPATAIGMLDRALARDGETIVITHNVAGSTPITQSVRASLRGYRADELTDSIDEHDSFGILSPTALSFIPVKLDRATIQGQVRVIQNVDTIMVADAVVRVEIQVKG